MIEILSPSNTHAYMLDKLADYGQMGVRECWIIHPEMRTVEVTRLSRQGMVVLHTFEMGEKLRSEVLPDLSVSVNEIFA